MKSWNVVATTHEHHFTEAHRYLDTYGDVQKTDFFNVLEVQVVDSDNFLQQLHKQLRDDPEIGSAVARVVPVSEIFTFQSPDEFEEKSKLAVSSWIEKLSGKSFHVRMHRRGFKGRLSSQDEEKFLDYFLLERISDKGASATLDFDDPDFIIAVETIGQQGGVSLWSRELLKRYPLVKLD